MNIITFSENLQKRMQEIDKSQEGDIVIRTGMKLTVAQGLIIELKQFTSSYIFTEIPEEITFFKEAKPVLLSQYFYLKKIFAIEIFDSFSDRKSRTKNYHRVLENMQRFVRKNLSFYQYCLSGSTSLDINYFTRNIQSPIDIAMDVRFSTGYDIILSKILAYEMVKTHITELLKKCNNDVPHSESQALAWTGSKTDLVELIYALHAVGSFNNATVEVRKIVEVFEILFNVNLGNYYRCFLGIRIRKTGQTAFLDQLKQRLVQRMNELEDR
jgi:hypothetical protein